MRRPLLILPMTLLALFAAVPMASAHTTLTASDPAEGASVAAPPSQITLTFNEPVKPEATTVTVAGADGTAWTVGQITAKDATVLVPVTPAGPAGPYTLTFKIDSVDDHPVTGTVKFTMAVPAATTTTVPPTTTTTAPSSSAPAVDPAASSSQPTGDGGVPFWVWIIVAVVVLAAAAFVVGRRKRTS